jgi:glutathione peroxidase
MRQRSEQYFTSSQFFSHFLRHVIGRAHVRQGFCGKNDLLPAKDVLFSVESLVFFAMILLDWITLWNCVLKGFLKDVSAMKKSSYLSHLSTDFACLDAMTCIGLTLVVALVAPASMVHANPSSPATCTPLLNQKFTSLQGKPQDFCNYSGKVVLVVNTASYCGFTDQYRGLQAIQDKYKDKGLVVIGFPANDFGKQEPGSNAEVADFCERTYKVKFPMIEKTSVLAGQANPLHEALFKATGERPKWNFHKYLIARDGKTVQSFGSKVGPESPEFTGQIEMLLAAK